MCVHLDGVSDSKLFEHSDILVSSSRYSFRLAVSAEETSIYIYRELNEQKQQQQREHMNINTQKVLFSWHCSFNFYIYSGCIFLIEFIHLDDVNCDDSFLFCFVFAKNNETYDDAGGVGAGAIIHTCICADNDCTAQ